MNDRLILSPKDFPSCTVSSGTRGGKEQVRPLQIVEQSQHCLFLRNVLRCHAGDMLFRNTQHFLRELLKWQRDL